MKTYRHDTWIYFGIPATIALLVYCAYASFVFDGPMNGGEAMRWGLISFSGLFAIVMLYLFLRFAIVRYHLTDEGIVVRGLFKTETRLWSEVLSLKVDPRFKYVLVRDQKGAVIVFSSTDYFRDINPFISEIHARILKR